MTGALYIVVSLKHSQPDDVYFWKANNAGYTNQPHDVGVYTHEQITSQLDYYNDGDSNIAIRVFPYSLFEISGISIHVDVETIQKFHYKTRNLYEK